MISKKRNTIGIHMAAAMMIIAGFA